MFRSVCVFDLNRHSIDSVSYLRIKIRIYWVKVLKKLEITKHFWLDHILTFILPQISTGKCEIHYCNKSIKFIYRSLAGRFFRKLELYNFFLARFFCFLRKAVFYPPHCSYLHSLLSTILHPPPFSTIKTIISKPTPFTRQYRWSSLLL